MSSDTLKTSQQEYCKVCKNRKLEISYNGFHCGLTSKAPSFTQECSDFDIDKDRVAQFSAINHLKAETELEKETGGLSKYGINNGIIAGLVLMGLAIVWLVVGLFVGYLFYYPFILFIIGMVLILKKTFKRE